MLRAFGRPPCCDVLRHVGCCWLKFDHFLNLNQQQSIRRNTVAKRTQYVAPNNVALVRCDRLAGVLSEFFLP